MNQRVYRELQRRGHEVTLVVPQTWPHDYSGGAITPTPLPGFNGLLRPLRVTFAGSVPLHMYLARPSRVVAEANPEVAYIEEESYSVAAWQWARALHRAGVSYVFYAAQNVAKHYPAPVRRMEQFVWRHATAAVAVSSGATETLRNRGFTGDVAPIPLSVDVDEFKPGLPRPARLAGANPRKQMVAFAGRLVEDKGVRVLLDAFRLLPQRAKTSLVLIGAGPLASAAGEDGVIVIEGVTHAEVPGYLAAADVLVAPSLTAPGWREQFGRVIIEAMACGVPVVGTDSGSIPELLAEGGGVMVPERNVEALASAISLLLEDGRTRAEMGARARGLATARYSVAAVTVKLEALLQRSIER